MNQSESKAFHKDFEQALVFATRLHADQIRKGSGIPYISHLIGVAGLVLEYGGGRDEAIAGLLHDSIEDQAQDFPGGPDALRAEINARFGPGVLAIVEGCTDAETWPKPPWKERKLAYIAHLEYAPEPVRLVSCADKLHNARAILGDLRVVGDALWDRFTASKQETLWYYQSLADAFIRLGPKALAGELRRTVDQMKALAEEG